MSTVSAKKKYSFDDHPEHKAQLEAWRDKWIANAFSTEPANREVMGDAINGLYDAAGLDRPLFVGFVRSPLAMAISGTVASGVWWLRDNPGRHRDLFGRVMAEPELMGAIAPACAYGISVAVTGKRPFSLPDATRAATYDATGAATRAATGAADPARSRLVSFLVRCAAQWYRMYDGGSDWSAYPAYLSFFDRVAELELPIYEKWRHYEQAALNAGPRLMHAKFCIVSDRHTEIHMDRNNQLHCETGPARVYGDGWALNYWHGFKVPADFFTWDVERVLKEENSEIRRCGIERVGWENLTDRLTLVAEAPDPGNAPHTLRLFKGDLLSDMYDEPARLLVAINGSLDKGGHRRQFGLPVPASVSDPVEAAALLFDVPVEVYRGLVRRS